MKNGSSKPCPGCKKVVPHRKADDVCMNCQSRLNGYDELVEKYKASGAKEILVTYKDRWYWNANLFQRSKQHRDYLGQKLFELVELLGKPAFDVNLHKGFEVLGPSTGGGGSGSTGVTMPKAVAELIRDIHKTIPIILKEEYEEGKADGHNLLMRLAQGDMSPNDYLEETEN